MDPLLSVKYQCTYCSEDNEVEVDITAGKKQSFTEDCAVCCRPNVVTCAIDDKGNVEFEVEFEG